MIELIDKTKCCGCTACYSACPEKCILMEQDLEGFVYPVADKSRCIECEACEKVCPFNNLGGETKKNTICAAVQYKDENKRAASTAGGVFSLIADYFLDNGGIVYAVGYENMVVSHKKCVDKNNLQEFRGSKYVQSSLNDVFCQIRMLLKKEQTVLFVGTPCQVHGLKNFVGDMENLYTIDLLCLGVSSPALFAEWITYLNHKYKCSVENVQFRNKHYGYATPNVRVVFENGKSMDQKYDTRVHANLFFRHYNVRPSCYECEFREVPRVSDFTIGDFTDIGTINKSMDDDKGTTKLWVHSEKGKELLSKIEKFATVYYIETNSANTIGGPKKQIKRPENREDFFNDVANLSYEKLIYKWEPRSFKGELVGFLRPILNKMPGKTAIFKFIRRRKLNKYNRTVKEINKTNQ